MPMRSIYVITINKLIKKYRQLKRILSNNQLQRMRILAKRELNKDQLRGHLSIGKGLFNEVRLMCIKDTGLKIKTENETQF